MGKVWLFSIPTVWIWVGLSVGCVGDSSLLASRDKPVAGDLARLSASSRKISAAHSSGKLTHNKLTHNSALAPHQQHSITSPLFSNGSDKTQPLGERLVSAVKENPISTVLGSFAHRSLELITPKPHLVHATDPLSIDHKSPPPGPELYTVMAQASERSGNVAQAVKLYQKALKVDPQNIDALTDYAHLLDRQERFDEAIRRYLQITSRFPEHAPTYNDLGLCYARQGRLAEAIESLERAVMLQPQRTLYRNNIALVLNKAGRTDEALRHLTAVHGEAIAYYNMGYLLHMQGKDRRAVGYFAAALQHNHSLAEAQYWLSRIENQSAAQVAVQPTVEVTDLPEVEDTAGRGLHPEPIQIPSYLPQRPSQTLADRRPGNGKADDRERAEVASTASLQIPSQVPDDVRSGRGALPPSPAQVPRYRLSAEPQPLPSVAGNEKRVRRYY